MRDVYEYCPEFETDKYLLRLISTEDTIDLFHREADEHFYECGLLRLDLRSIKFREENFSFQEKFEERFLERN